MNNSKRVPINCAERRTPQKTPLQIGKLGYTHDNIPSTFLYCRGHRHFHACTLLQMHQSWREMAAGDPVLLQAYATVLGKAILDIKSDLEDLEQESAS